jgi:Rapamycin-insensitive companion of mTOR, middle domain
MYLQFIGAPESDPIFSKKRVADTLTYGYLEMLGTLSKHEEGIKHVITSCLSHRVLTRTPQIDGEGETVHRLLSPK